MKARTRSWIAVTVALIAIFLMPGRVWPWDRLGHRVTARIAEAQLNPRALAAVHDLLGAGASLADVSTWADEQRDSRSGPWHYVNVPITKSRYESRYCQWGGCVVSKIHDFDRVLKSPSAGKDQKQQALKFLIHLIADVHQPFNVGDTGSRRGSLIQVRFFGLESNLHRVWDSQIINHHTENEEVWLFDCNLLASPKMIEAWSKGTPEDWATESLQVAKEAYCLPGTKKVMPSGTALGDDYCRMALPMIQRQLAKAGIRIAWTLNEIFR